VATSNQPATHLAAQAVSDLLDHCARLQRGQRVLIVAALDGLQSGFNLVEEAAVELVAEGVRQRGARPSVLWVEVESTAHAWRVPEAVKKALSETDLLINHVFDLPYEELHELRDLLARYRVPMVRNMATTESLLASDWGRTPYELVSEIRYHTAASFREGVSWSLTHPNGTELRGTIGAPLPPFKHYAERRTEGFYRPFPEGVFTPVNLLDTRGTLVFDRTLPWWARYAGLPARFRDPVSVTIEKNRLNYFAGGSEAQAMNRFFSSLAERLGPAVYELAGLHGGVHPHGCVSATECPEAFYREFVEHHHTGSLHLHLGRAPEGGSYPYMIHVTAELRGATLRIGATTLCERGELSVLKAPAIQALVDRYPGRPGLPAAEPTSSSE
jgi:hypothetical protein